MLVVLSSNSRPDSTLVINSLVFDRDFAIRSINAFNRHGTDVLVNRLTNTGVFKNNFTGVIIV